MLRYSALRSSLLTILLVTVAAVRVPMPYVPAVLADGVTVSGPGSALNMDDDGQNDNDSGKGNDKDKDKNKDKDKEKEKDEHGKKGKKGGTFTPAAPYHVAAECAYDAAADETTCTFTGSAPAGAKDVGHIDLPASAVCADVVGGEYEYVNPDPNTGVVGYKSRGSKGTFSLVMTGKVTPGGQTSYWFKTGDGVFPATGPGLICDATAGQAPTTTAAPAPQTTATATVTPAATAVTTGTITVQTYRCAETPATDDFDWYGQCTPGMPAINLTLSLIGETGNTPAGQGITTAEGDLQFTDLAPGAYHLEAQDVAWCHAESDHVDSQGDLVVAAGGSVTVWMFFCDQAAGS